MGKNKKKFNTFYLSAEERISAELSERVMKIAHGEYQFNDKVSSEHKEWWLTNAVQTLVEYVKHYYINDSRCACQPEGLNLSL